MKATIERLHELLELKDGKLFWKIRRAQIAAGARAGCKANGYRLVRIDDVLYKEHRVIFAMTNGHWPDKRLDHRNCIRDDNDPKNLREATGSQNIQNSPIRSDNTSGVKGVYWAAHAGKWRARITVEKKHIHLGYYDDLELAAFVRSVAALKHHGEFARLA